MRRNISACANSDSACRLSTNFIVSNLCASSSACLTWSIWSFKLLISSPSTFLRCSYYSSVLESTSVLVVIRPMVLILFSRCHYFARNCHQMKSSISHYFKSQCVCVCVRVCVCVYVYALCVCVRVIPVGKAQDPTSTSLCSHLMLRLWISEHPTHCEDPCF